ncbi:uncharacterized protein LOC118751244 [Rhagoletis pomonella]|uniref:uncharacterized protein LOC118751244 n=1 Tax=Rhagoletis pomonella TaxID=28610 RepID=UPI001782ABEB|nr:uncharacterized protein LOC118751244 [Rhagoletis pomonella]
MRRSQRLMKKTEITNKPTDLVYGSTPGYDKANMDIKIQRDNEDNGSVTNETKFNRLPTPVGKVYSSELSNDITSHKFVSTGIVGAIPINTQKKNPISKQRNQKRGHRSAAVASTASKGRKKRITQKKTPGQRKSSLAAAMENNEIKAPTISIDSYLNPLRDPLIRTEVTARPMESKSLYSCNKGIPTMSIQSNTYSLLPPIYPTHFTNQNFDDKLNNPTSQWKPASVYNKNVLPETNFPTPELTQTLDFDSSTSTLSLPESLREVFGCDDIRDILKLDKVIFRMQVLHLQTLAYVLNIQYDYLINLVEKIMKLDTETLKKVAFAFQPEAVPTKCPTINIEEKFILLD